MKKLYKILIVLAIFIAPISCKNETPSDFNEDIVENKPDENDENPPEDPAPAAIPEVSNLTAIFYDGKAHLSWKHSQSADAEIYFGEEKIGETQNASSADFSCFTDENSYDGKTYIVKAKDAQGQTSAGAAVSAAETGLPIVEITTNDGGDVLQDDTYVGATMKVYNGDTQTVYENMKISVRGNATAGYPKKPYKIKLQESAALLGMNSESKKWTFLASYCDKTLLRAELGFKVSEILEMEYTPDRRFADVFVNGEYKGNYLICDSIEQNKNRVPVDKDMGCIIEIDNGYYRNEPYHFETKICGNFFTFKHPDGDDIKAEDETATAVAEYIEDYVNEFEKVLASENFDDEENGYSKYIDADAFAKWLLVQEITANLDTNWYFYKKDNTEQTKLKMGPVWDFEWSVGIGWYYGTRPKSADGYVLTKSYYFDRLITDPNFSEKIKTLWNKKYTEIQNLCKYLDEKAFEIAKSQRCNFARWPILDTQVSVGGIPLGSYESELECDKQYLANRISWISSHIADLQTPLFQSESPPALASDSVTLTLPLPSAALSSAAAALIFPSRV
ncbi:MAG: CotH kinase family protein [Bacteroides sp.]|nr:CotH kinase family protein [Prevotella sp.]MCM1407825.1 CotH kinase family protein [Treponema brennaborense]MCM1470878.1 CotH kinase family protein [Bacteroides sp.]